MKKDFDVWNKLKKEIDNSKVDFYVQTRQIWWCSLGVNIGSEQNGHGECFERPVIVIRKYTSDTFLCIPLTTKEKSGNYYYKMGDNLEITSYAILSQAKVLDRKRLRRLIGMVPHKEFHEIIDRYKNLI
ncbi:MAG: type II toxin-antitoxin system PemK/MazF family toxin [bacterium]